jgi:outer membrane immunogenic protein
MKKLVLAAMLAGTCASPAFAQSTTDLSPFTGARVEGLIGYDILKSGGDNDDGVNSSEDEGDESIEGAVFGVAAGFDFDLGGVVAGVEAEFSESTGEQEANESVDIPISSSIETGRDLYVGGRIGILATPMTLVYAKGGYTNTSIEANFEDTTALREFDTNADGWRVGAGIEQLFGPNAYAKVEYRYSNYNTLDFSDNADFETDVDLDRHQIVAGVGFRF